MLRSQEKYEEQCQLIKHCFPNRVRLFFDQFSEQMFEIIQITVLSAFQRKTVDTLLFHYTIRNVKHSRTLSVKILSS